MNICFAFKLKSSLLSRILQLSNIMVLHNISNELNRKERKERREGEWRGERGERGAGKRERKKGGDKERYKPIGIYLGTFAPISVNVTIIICSMHLYHINHINWMALFPSNSFKPSFFFFFYFFMVDTK